MEADQTTLFDATDEAEIVFSRKWGMPTRDTFDCPPIADFVRCYVSPRHVSVDPFARNCLLATYRNDINPTTQAEYHMDAVGFLSLMKTQKVVADRILLDPPYSPRQISECYKEIGRACSMQDTQNAKFYKEVRDAAAQLCVPGSIVLSFGWNSAGMGKDRGFRIIEMMLVPHGGAHNDTICMAEVRR